MRLAAHSSLHSKNGVGRTTMKKLTVLVALLAVFAVTAEMARAEEVEQTSSPATLTSCAIPTQIAKPDSVFATTLRATSVQSYKNLILCSQVGDADQPTLERWYRTWKEIRRRTGWDDFTKFTKAANPGAPSLPPDPVKIYLLTPANFNLHAPQVCGGRCDGGGVYDGVIDAIITTGYDDFMPEYKFSSGSWLVTHELQHRALGWIYEPSDYFAATLDISPYLLYLSAIAVSRLQEEMGPDPNPMVFDPTRTAKLQSIVKAMLPLPDLNRFNALFEAQLQDVRLTHDGLRGHGGNAEQGSAIATIQFYISIFDRHHEKYWGGRFFADVVNSIVREVQSQCEADGGC